MILKIIKITLIICIAVNCVSGAAFSKVFVHSGSEAHPVEYIQYGVPPVSLPGPQIGQISAGSAGQVVSSPSAPGIVGPCVMPCVYPGQLLSAVAPISSAAPNIITYKSSIPVVMPSKEEAPGYEYSYFVYDENTGDHKSQYELSDGSTVRGEYSFRQPDGLVREVTYVADNTKGFNAIVKHFLPEKEQNKKESKEKTNQQQPCPEVKKEVPEIPEVKPDKPSEETSQKLSKLVVGNENKVNSSKNDQNETTEKSEQKTEIKESTLKVAPTEKISTNENIKKDSGTGTNKGLVNVALTEDTPKHQTEQPLIETQQHITPAVVHEPVVSPAEDKKVSISEGSKAELKDSTELRALNTQAAPKVGLEETDILIPYSDIIKCVQAAVNSASKNSGVRKSESPLTYIVLNKPC